MFALLLPVGLLLTSNVQDEPSSDFKKIEAGFKVLQTSAKESDWKKYVSRLSPGEQESLIVNIYIFVDLSGNPALTSKFKSIVKENEQGKNKSSELALVDLLKTVDPLFKNSLEGKMKDLKVDGDRASAKLTGNPNTGYDVSLYFKKFQGKWKLSSTEEYRKSDVEEKGKQKGTGRHSPWPT